MSATTTAIASPAPATTLKSLYPSAARAFVDRNVVLTASLVDKAFPLLPPPPPLPAQDPLASHRRKWDMLRVTLETTLRCAPPPLPQALPNALRDALSQPAPALLAALYARSLRLFTPQDLKPSPAHLPSQVVINLALAALKLDCPSDARAILEQWLAQHPPPQPQTEHARVIELYVLHVLPRCAAWDAAATVLAHDPILSKQTKQQLARALKAARADAQRRAAPSPAPSDRTARRAPSPSPSTSSVSSTSTHTARPPAAAPAPAPLARRAATPPPAPPSRASSVTATPRAGPVVPTAPPFLALASRLRGAIALLLALAPLLLWLAFRRRRRPGAGALPAAAPPAAASAADTARRRLRAAGRDWWAAALRAVLDTARMAAGGLG